MSLPIDKKALLANHFLFRSLNPKQLEQLLMLAVEKRYRNGQMIFRKGEEGASMMIILNGKVRVTATAEDGREIILNTLEPGGVLGELALLDGQCRSADATAIGTSSLLFLMRSEFMPLLRQDAEMAIQLLSVLCEKLRNTSDTLENVGLLPVPSRLARLILKLARAKDPKPPAGMEIQLSLSQREMGNLVGTSRESVNKTLSQWQSQGLVRLQQSRLTLLKPGEMSLISEALL
jgi:CRP-like cAMP-binding protein